MRIDKKEELQWITFENLEATTMVKHCFTTRLGGVSEGVHGALNLGFSRGDKVENVLENYSIIGDALDFSKDNYVTAQQTHSTNVVRVYEKHKGAGVLQKRVFEEVDALITNEVGIPLVIFGADCVPVFFLDTQNKAIGIAHCGWVGTGNRMAEKTLQAMIDAFGTNPKDVVVGIGPSIGKCCFQMDQPVLDLFEKNISFAKEFIFPDKEEKGKYFMDLWEINARLLEDMGVSNIEISGLCTMCTKDLFYSHRFMGENRGSMAGIMEIKA